MVTKYKNPKLKEWKERIKNRKITVGILGLGYVGLPLAIEFSDASINTIGFDINKNTVNTLNSKKSIIKHIPDEKVKNSIEKNTFTATDDMSKISEADAILICVPTPLTKNREPDMQFIIKSCETISKYLKKGQLVILESTTYPGTTNDIMKPILENSGLVAGKDFYIAYSPEREDPGNKKFTTSKIPKVVGGINKLSREFARALYNQIIVKTIPVSSLEVAEATKIMENVYRCINIAMVNELKIVFDKMGIDIWEVIEAASTKPFGYHPFYPGPGLGGHCIPIDPFYLTWRARQFEIPTKFIELAGEINTQMPEYVIIKTMEALNKRKKSLNGSKVLVLGLAYKKNIDDLRESPSIKLIELLKQKGAIVDYNDPYIKETHKQREHDLQMKSVPLTKENLKNYDAVIISTDHSDYDFEFILENSKIIIDTRNSTSKTKKFKDKITKA